MNKLKDYRVKVQIRNNYLLTAIQEAGFDSIASFCREYDLSQQGVGRVGTLQLTLYKGKNGAVRNIYLKLSEALRCLPEDLVPPQHATKKLKTRSVEIEASMEDIQTLLPEFNGDAPQHLMLENKEFSGLITDVLDSLSEQESDILKRRFGLGDYDPHTLEEVADRMGVGRERIRQIEAKALRKLNHPSRAGLLRKHCPSDYPQPLH